MTHSSVTGPRDLRTGRSPWRARGRGALEGTALPRKSHCDVAIVGAGISGALIAWSLCRRGLDVVMIDRRGAVRGSTAASTALLLHEIDTPLSRLCRSLGTEPAMRVWQRSKLALDALQGLLITAGIDAALQPRCSLYLAGDLLDADGLRREQRARQRAGFAVEFLAAADVRERYGIGRRSALLSHGNLEADPVAMTLALLKGAQRFGLRIYTPHDVCTVEPNAHRVWLATRDGKAVAASRVVFASGYEMLDAVPRAGNRVASTWVIATRPQPRRLWRDRCLIWEASEPYLYVRTDHLNRVICGGEDEPFADEASRDALLPSKARTLAAKLARLLPGVDSAPAFAWCASFGASTSGLPTIAAVPGLPRCYTAMGFGGNGITYSMLAAQLLTAEICGVPDPDAPLFGFASAAQKGK